MLLCTVCTASKYSELREDLLSFYPWTSSNSKKIPSKKHIIFILTFSVREKKENGWKSQLENKTHNKIHVACDEMNMLATWKGTNCASIWWDSERKISAKWSLYFSHEHIFHKWNFVYTYTFMQSARFRYELDEATNSQESRICVWCYGFDIFFWVLVQRKKTDVTILSIKTISRKRKATKIRNPSEFKLSAFTVSTVAPLWNVTHEIAATTAECGRSVFAVEPRRKNSNETFLSANACLHQPLLMNFVFG